MAGKNSTTSKVKKEDKGIDMEMIEDLIMRIDNAEDTINESVEKINNLVPRISKVEARLGI